MRMGGLVDKGYMDTPDDDDDDESIIVIIIVSNYYFISKTIYFYPVKQISHSLCALFNQKKPNLPDFVIHSCY